MHTWCARRRASTWLQATPGSRLAGAGSACRGRGMSAARDARYSPPLGATLRPSHGDGARHALSLVVSDGAVPLVPAGLIEIGPKCGRLPGRDLLGLDLAGRSLDLERVDNLAGVLHSELDDSRLVDAAFFGANFLSVSRTLMVRD